MRWVERGFLEGLQFFKNFEKNRYLEKPVPHFQKTMKFVKICKKHVLPMAGGMFSIAKKQYISVQVPHTISLEITQIQ